MAQKSTRPAGQHRRVVAPAPMKRELPDRVDPRVEANEAALLYSPVDGLARETTLVQLRGGDDAVLMGREQRHTLVGRERPPGRPILHMR